MCACSEASRWKSTESVRPLVHSLPRSPSEAAFKIATGARRYAGSIGLALYEFRVLLLRVLPDFALRFGKQLALFGRRDQREVDLMLDDQVDPCGPRRIGRVETAFFHSPFTWHCVRSSDGLHSLIALV